MKIHYDKKLKKFSRTLRQKMTDVERLFWSKIRMRQLNGYQFYRQRPIGEYVVDFYCPRAKLIIEIDGGQHYEDDGRRKDEMRDKFLSGIGLKILRFSDRDVIENIEGVVEHVLENLE
ncbi:MAG TPA: endonuclease domain-containing protein [bacterium]|nr:endonuclease domain-containing protein [bacterium]